MTEHDPDTAAAELALGLLDGDERAAVLRRVLAEPAFAAAVARWRLHFADLFPAVADVAPDEALLARVERSLDGAPAEQAVVPVRRRWAWPSVAGLSSMAAAIMLAVLLLRPPAVQPVQPTAPVLLAAAVVPTTGEPMAAVYDASAGSLRMTAAAMADARHSAQLWVIGGDGVPHSLGLLSGGGVTAMVVPDAMRGRLAAAAVLAVSIEPVGGSRTGLPTGPVVAKGTLALS